MLSLCIQFWLYVGFKQPMWGVQWGLFRFDLKPLIKRLKHQSVQYFGSINYLPCVLIWPSRLGLGVRLTTPSRKRMLLRNLKRRPRPTQGCRADDDDDDDDDDDMSLSESRHSPVTLVTFTSEESLFDCRQKYRWCSVFGEVRTDRPWCPSSVMFHG
jgi:hypothetical protein